MPKILKQIKIDFLIVFLLAFSLFFLTIISFLVTKNSFAKDKATTTISSPPTTSTEFDDEYNDTTPGIWHGNRDQRQDQFYQDSTNIDCTGGLCKIFSVNVHKRKWAVTAHIGLNDFGYGNGGNSGGGGGYYSTNNCGKVTTTSSNSNCYGNYYNGTTLTSGEYNPIIFSAGVSVTWEDVNCTKTINVDKSVYRAITTYMKSLTNEDGTTRPAFTPAEQTMILFYTTIMKLTNGFTCE
ncbi:MAG: hypothetical protein HQK51_19815 [Oligoflexia bacterium]|nr:hypothetical protein [Oligoflexia bacterium]